MSAPNGAGASAKDNGIVFFGYELSPFARRVVFYLQLRGLKFARCAQPPVLPRPDLAALGVHYRRIPVLAINGDIYTDSALILAALEGSFPNSTLTPPAGTPAAIGGLLERWTVDGGVFMRAVQCLPLDMGIFENEAFVKDREAYAGPGADWGIEAFRKTRGEAQAETRESLEFLEHGLLSDGREWIAGTPGVSLADLSAIWPFHWLWTIPGSYDDKVINEKEFPKVFAWIKRFDAVTKKAAEAYGEIEEIDGKEAHARVAGARFADAKASVDSKDPLGLKEGQQVQFFPLDSGSAQKQPGKLVKLDKDGSAVEVQAEGGKAVRVHAPRHNFRVEAV